MMDMLKFAVPVVTGMLGLAKLLDEKIKYFKLLTTVLIILGGAGSAVMVWHSGRAEAQKARAAEQAQLRAEEKLDRMSDALLDIQQDLAALQLQLARGPQGGAEAAATRTAVSNTLAKLDGARGIMEEKGTPGSSGTPAPAATKPAAGAASDK